MNKEQERTLKELIADKNTIGTNLLKWVLWRNTVKPAFKVGEYVRVTDKNHYIGDRPVIDWQGKVKRIFSFIQDFNIHYEVEVICQYLDKNGNEKQYVGTVCGTEGSTVVKAEMQEEIITII